MRRSSRLNLCTSSRRLDNRNEISDTMKMMNDNNKRRERSARWPISFRARATNTFCRRNRIRVASYQVDEWIANSTWKNKKLTLLFTHSRQLILLTLRSSKVFSLPRISHSGNFFFSLSNFDDSLKCHREGAQAVKIAKIWNSLSQVRSLCHAESSLLP